MRTLAFGVCLQLTLLCLYLPSANAEEWGTLRGKFVLEGDAPAATKVAVTKDLEFCNQKQLLDESLVVGKSGGVANIAVYVRTKRGMKLNVHPDYEKTAKAQVVLDNKFCRFEPHVTLYRTGQELVLKNSDSVGHNTNCDLFTNQSFNILIPAGKQATQPLYAAERLPAKVACNIHPWMTGYLIVRDDPYMAVTDENGEFEIKNLPAGEHEFQFWHETAGYLGNVKMKNVETSKKGRAKINISGDVDLGTAKLKASQFE